MDFELFSLMVSGLVNDFPVRYRTQEGLPVVCVFHPHIFCIRSLQSTLEQRQKAGKSQVGADQSESSSFFVVRSTCGMVILHERLRSFKEKQFV